MLWLLVLLSDNTLREEADLMKCELADLSRWEVVDYFLPLGQSVVAGDTGGGRNSVPSL